MRRHFRLFWKLFGRIQAKKKIKMIITIDGPAGSGKSSVANSLARKLHFLHLNSGLLYRAVGYVAAKKQISNEDEEGLIDIARSLRFDFLLDVVDFRTDIRVLFVPDNIYIDTKTLSMDEWSQAASKIGTLKGVRELLTEVQRNLGRDNSLVLEGRDSGSVVFPDADFKFFLDAPLEARAIRRFVQIHGNESKVDEEEKNKILSEIRKRDERDANRTIAPQVVPDNAEVIHTGNLSLDEVVAAICKKISIEGSK